MALSKEEKIKQLEIRLKNLKASDAKEKRRERTKELIQIGAALTTIYDRDILLKAIQIPAFMKYVKDSFILQNLVKEKDAHISQESLINPEIKI
jgi:hypothetical protein